MPRCAVPDCDSGTFSERKKTKAAGVRSKSYFSFPKNPELLLKWKENLFHGKDENINNNSKVCEKHFDEADIIKHDTEILSNGAIYTSERERYKLNKEAVPLFFKHPESHVEGHRDNQSMRKQGVITYTDGDIDKATPSKRKDLTNNSSKSSKKYHDKNNVNVTQDINKVKVIRRTLVDKNSTLIEHPNYANNDNFISINHFEKENSAQLAAHRNVSQLSNEQTIPTCSDNLCNDMLPQYINKDPVQTMLISNDDVKDHAIHYDSNQHPECVQKQIHEEDYQQDCVTDYNFEKLKNELLNHSFTLPQNWTYSFQNNELIIFTHIHVFPSRIHLMCIIHNDFSVQISTFDHRKIENVNITFGSNENLLNFLIQLEQKKCCEGTGINNAYSEECEGFLPPDQVYGKSRGYERCIACRNQRKLIQKKNYNYTTNQNKYKKQGRVIKNVLRENVSLKERKIWK